MEAERKSRIHPLMAGAAAAVILASGVGVAAMTGLLPGSNAEKAPEPAQMPVSKAAPQKPAAAASAPKPTQMASTAKICANCAVVTDVKAVEVKGEGSGLGAVAGGVAGAVVGNQFGRGDGRTIMTVAGAAGGALAGNELEKHARTHKRYDVALRMEDGTMKTVHMDAAPTWRSGDRVRVVDGKIEPRI